MLFIAMIYPLFQELPRAQNEGEWVGTGNYSEQFILKPICHTVYVSEECRANLSFINCVSKLFVTKALMGNCNTSVNPNLENI
jgi:hypothetical protein